jgi:hypothetical protein
VTASSSFAAAEMFSSIENLQGGRVVLPSKNRTSFLTSRALVCCLKVPSASAGGRGRGQRASSQLQVHAAAPVAGTPRRGGATGGESARDGAGRCRPGRRWPRARRRRKMPGPSTELDAASGGARSTAEASPESAEMTLGEGPVTFWAPAMPSATARRARERAPGGFGVDGISFTVQAWSI